MTAEVSIQSVRQQFGNFVALDDVSLEIAAGEFVVLLGPSGCGKSTLLFILGGFLTPSKGRVLIGGRDMAGVLPKDRPTTTMFQDYALFPHMSLLDNVAFGLRMKGVAKRTRAARAHEMLEMVGLADKAVQRPHELSGGQRQRVALARALAVDPDVLLLDEPLGALDLKLRRQMQNELKAIQRKVGTTFVHVTHDQEEAMAIADRIVVMNHGKIEDVGPPDAVYLRPKTLFSANFMGDINLLDPERLDPEGRAAAQGLIAGAVGRDAVLCARPENIGLSGDLPLGRFRLDSVSFFGTYHRCRFRSERDEAFDVLAHLPLGGAPEAGARVMLYASRATVVEKPG